MIWRWLQQNAQFCCIFMSIGIVLLMAHGIDGQILQQLPQQQQQQQPRQQPQQPLHQPQHQPQHHQQQQQQQHQPQKQQQQHQPHHQPQQQRTQQQQHHPPTLQPHHQQQTHAQQLHHGHSGSGSHNVLESRSSYALLSQAMSEAVIHEFSGTGSGSAPDGACLADDLECLGNVHDRLGMEAIKSLHQQLDDDDNGNIDLTESDDFLREELKYDSGYEKRHKTFHYNDDTQISVKELWEAWMRSAVHNWTVEQTTDWLSQSVQLPQYVELFQKHKVSGETLPRLAVHNMHYVSTVLGIRDPIHKQKIALKAMDVVLFGPPRETGTRWKDYFLVTLLLSAIIGCWYAYQQNKNAKKHLRRMAQDMEGLQRAENALTDLQKELELARLEQENVATEKLDLERRLKEAPSLSSSSSDLELQQLKQEVEMLRAELNRAEVELVDHCWTPPQALQSWLQLTYELESKHTLKKRVQAEKQLQLAREACEKLKRKRTSLVGAFVSTHGKSIDDVDRSIVEARNALSEVTNELQERLHRWKVMESMLGFSIVNNNGLAYLETVLYNRNGSGKSSRNRISGSQDELDDESVQGYHDNHGRVYREDSSGSDDGDTVTFILGGGTDDAVRPAPSSLSIAAAPLPASSSSSSARMTNTFSSQYVVSAAISPTSSTQQQQQQQPQQQQQQLSPLQSQIASSMSALSGLQQQNSSNHQMISSTESSSHSAGDDSRRSPLSLDRVMPLPRTKKILPVVATTATSERPYSMPGSNRSSAPMPPPRRANSQQSFAFISLNRPQSADLESMESPSSALSSSAYGLSVGAGDVQIQQQQQQSLDDTCSTDSSSFDGAEFKKRRRKLHFPFGKKTHKAKPNAAHKP